MEEIIALKEKHLAISPSQLKELSQRHLTFLDHIKRKQDQLLSEDEAKIEELISKINDMKEEFRSENQTLEYKNRELLKHLDYVKQMEIEKKKFQDEIQTLEVQRNQLRKSKPNAADERLLEQGRRKYNLYKEFTRIQWDYESREKNINNVKGYVSNRKDYIHSFSYKTEDKNLSDVLWDEIYRSTNSNHDADTNNAENIAPNK